jgi:hypothetical protein
MMRLFLLISLLGLTVTACQRPIIQHGSLLTLSGKLALKSEDIAKGELCINFQTKETAADDATKTKIENHYFCFNASVVDGEINLRKMLTFESQYSDLTILNVSNIKFKVRTQVSNREYAAFNIYKGQVEDFSNPKKNLNVKLSFSFEKISIVHKLAAIARGCNHVKSDNVADCVRWKIDPVSALACAQATNTRYHERNCLREVAIGQGTFK